MAPIKSESNVDAPLDAGLGIDLPPGHFIVPGEPSLPFLVAPSTTSLKGQQHPDAPVAQAAEG